MRPSDGIPTHQVGEVDENTKLHSEIARITNKYGNVGLVQAQLVFDGLDFLLQAAAQGDPEARGVLQNMKSKLERILSVDDKILVPRGPVVT